MNEPDTAFDGPVVKGKLTSSFDSTILDWGIDSFKKSLDNAKDALQRLVALNLTLLGGSLFLKEDICSGWWRATASIAFLISLAAAFYGTLPRATEVNLGQPDSILEQKRQLGTFRDRCLKTAAITIVVGMAAAVVGSLVKGVG